MHFVPYALVATSFYWNTAPLSSADAPTLASGGTQSSFGATTRQSRFGLRMRAPAVARAIAADEVAAVGEVDFFGGYYASNDTTYFMPHVRLRLLLLSATYGPISIVVGQDTMVLAPLNPFSMTHVAVAGFQSAGNAWARIPQVRVDLRVRGLLLQAAVLAPAGAGQVEASASGLVVGRAPGRADRSGSPSLQARAAYALRLTDDRAITAGASVHYGRDESMVEEGSTAPPATVTSYAAAFDLDAPVLEWLALRAEGYVGQDLDGFFVDADVVGDEPVPVIGGWCQLSVRIPPLAFHFGGGIEDPRAPEGSALPTGAITNARAIYAALGATFGPLTLGVELTSVWTGRAAMGSARGEQVAFALLTQL
ncbi:MAG: hypothetical protein IT379_39140 [Deltaproteobacteria bacterium]|nr:hypothetical protein [Deltaproteobacteria bacterium]